MFALFRFAYLVWMISFLNAINLFLDLRISINYVLSV